MVSSNSRYDKISTSWQKLLEVCQCVIDNVENTLPKNGLPLQKAARKGYLAIHPLIFQKITNTQEIRKASNLDDIQKLGTLMTDFYTTNPSRKCQNPLHFAAMTGKIQVNYYFHLVNSR